MPAPHPPEFHQRAVELAREREKPIKHIARDLGISESCLRNWVAQADVDAGTREGLTTSEREELRKLRSELRVVKMERDILKKAAAFFATENVLPRQ
jgi:transposase